MKPCEKLSASHCYHSESGGDTPCNTSPENSDVHTERPSPVYTSGYRYIWMCVYIHVSFGEVAVRPQPSARPSPDQNTLPCLLWRCCLTWSASPLVFHHNSQWQQSTASAHTATHEPSQNTELCDSGGGEIEIWHKREGRRWQREKDRGQEDRNSKRKGQKGGGVGGYCHVYNLLSTIPLKNLLFFSSWF